MAMKSVYFAQANPALGERFRPRWRRHAALAMSMPRLWNLLARYCQYDPVANPPAAIGATARYDGIGMSWYADAQARSAMDDSEELIRMRADEMEVFGRFVREVAMPCEETVHSDSGHGGFKVFCILDRCPDATAEQFRAAMEHNLAITLLNDPGLDGLITRLATCVATGRAGRKNDGLLELSFDSLDDAAAVMASAGFARAMAGQAAHFSEVERCVTREVLLDDCALCN